MIFSGKSLFMRNKYRLSSSLTNEMSGKRRRFESGREAAQADEYFALGAVAIHPRVLAIAATSVKKFQFMAEDSNLRSNCA